MARKIFLIASLLLGLTFAAPAQQITGNVEGRILDPEGRPLPAVNIVVTSPSLQGIRGTTTDERGYFRLLALRPGTYSLKITHIAHHNVELDDVIVSLGKTVAVGDIKLTTRTLEMPEAIVHGESPLIDPGTTSFGANLRANEFERLPLERNYRNLATLLPQANISYLGDEINFAGATGFENKYFVDGVDVTDPSFATATTLPYNFIKEIDVTIGGYEAEYRSSLGGLSNVITHSGSNEFHGSVFGFFSNNGLSASRRGSLLDPSQGDFSNYDIGFGVGGPIIRDKLWFYTAYNPTFNQRDVEIPGLGFFEDKTITHSFAGKLTWQATQRLNLVLTASGDPSVREAVGDVPPAAGTATKLENPDPFLTDHTKGGVNLSLSGTHLLTERILLNASLSRTTRDRTRKPSTERGENELALIDNETGTWSGGSFGNESFFRSATTARSGATILASSHIFKAGIEYRNNKMDVSIDFPKLLFRNSDTLYTFIENNAQGKIQNRILSGFVQDSWQISHNLSIHAGLRWDGQSVLAGNGKEVHRIDGPLQPRVGFVFLPNAEGTQKVFGSFGRFIQEWSSAVMTIYTGVGYFNIIDFNEDPRLRDVDGDTLLSVPSVIPPRISLRGQHYDEFSLGYERLIYPKVKMGIRGIFRKLREAINVGLEFAGNPGRGAMADLPRPRRDYAALVVTLERFGGDNFNFLASYVLSRNYGNYEGLYDSYNHNIVPNVNFTFADANSLKNATGLLPSDRTHVLKFSGSYRFAFGLVAGTSFTWQSGTPLSDMAGLFGNFLQKRGTVGRTPGIGDLNARLVYPVSLAGRRQASLILDLFHIVNQREPVEFVQQHYFDVDEDGNPIDLNPNYGIATRFQPSFSLRLGMEVEF